MSEPAANQGGAANLAKQVANNLTELEAACPGISAVALANGVYSVPKTRLETIWRSVTRAEDDRAVELLELTNIDAAEPFDEDALGTSGSPAAVRTAALPAPRPPPPKPSSPGATPPPPIAKPSSPGTVPAPRASSPGPLPPPVPPPRASSPGPVPPAPRSNPALNLQATLQGANKSVPIAAVRAPIAVKVEAAPPLVGIGISPRAQSKPEIKQAMRAPMVSDVDDWDLPPSSPGDRATIEEETPISGEQPQRKIIPIRKSSRPPASVAAASTPEPLSIGASLSAKATQLPRRRLDSSLSNQGGPTKQTILGIRASVPDQGNGLVSIPVQVKPGVEIARQSPDSRRTLAGIGGTEVEAEVWLKQTRLSPSKSVAENVDLLALEGPPEPPRAPASNRGSHPHGRRQPAASVAAESPAWPAPDFIPAQVHKQTLAGISAAEAEARQREAEAHQREADARQKEADAHARGARARAQAQAQLAQAQAQAQAHAFEARSHAPEDMIATLTGPVGVPVPLPSAPAFPTFGSPPVSARTPAPASVHQPEALAAPVWRTIEKEAPPPFSPMVVRPAVPLPPPPPEPRNSTALWIACIVLAGAVGGTAAKLLTTEEPDPNVRPSATAPAPKPAPSPVVSASLGTITPPASAQAVPSASASSSSKAKTKGPMKKSGVF